MAPLKILIVEDESIIVRDIQNSLVNLGYSVVAMVSTGEDAIKAAESKTPDIILMDIVLRGEMDGIDTANTIRTRFNIPVIYCTAYADDKMLERAKITDSFGYLIKPFEDRELNITIEMAIYKHKMQTKLKENEEFLDTTLKSINDAIIATDTKGCITFINPVAQKLINLNTDEASGREAQQVLNIVNADNEKIECPVMKVLRKNTATNQANDILKINDKTKIQIEHSATAIRNDSGEITGVVMVLRDITSRVKTEKAREKLIYKLQEALNKIRTLSGLLPICAACKKIRDDQGYWKQIEHYIQEHSDAEFTHSICPECTHELYPELYGPEESSLV